MLGSDRGNADRRARFNEFARMRTPEEAAVLLAGGCGCGDGSEALAADNVVSLATDAVAATWEGVIGVENELTGDGRFIETNALAWETPSPLRYAPVDNGGHDGAVDVGRILTIERRGDGTIWATGDFDGGSEHALEAIRVVREQLTRGVSMDLDSVAFEVRVAREILDGMAEPLPDGEEPFGEADDSGRVTVYKASADDEVMVMTSARIRGATIVSIPAFSRALIDVTSPESTAESLAASGAVFALEASPAEEIPDGATCSFEGCDAEATHEVSDTGDGDGERTLYCQTHAEQVVAEANESDDSSEGEASVTSIVAGAAPSAPPAEWFRDPSLSGPTPLTVTEDGRVFGHLATWGTCHTAYPGQCVEPPRSKTSYSYFRTGAVFTAEGTEVAVGGLTMDTLHADASYPASKTLAHYEHTGRRVANVAAGEDAYGIWVAGAMVPTATDEQIRALRTTPLSGDWRRIGGNLELVGALAVNVPGFPIPRPNGLMASGVMQSLVASGMVAPREVVAPGLPGSLTSEDLRWLKRMASREKQMVADETRRKADELASRTRATRAAALAAKIGISH